MIQTINARFDCRGYYLRWYFNGWHHYFFKVADEIQQTEGQKYQTQMSTKLVVGDDNIRKNQMLAFTGLMRSKHIFMLTEDGWKACTIVDTDLPYGRADHPGARVEFTLNVWAKKGLFTPLLEVDIRPVSPTIIYGYLYNWWVTQEQISSSADWAVPTYNQILDFISYLTTTYTISNTNIANGLGNHLKSTRVVPDPHPRWDINTTHTPFDTWNFNYLPGGWRVFDTANFIYIGARGFIWTTYDGGTTGISYALRFDEGDFKGASTQKKQGLTIKLIRNATALEIANNSDGDASEPYTGNDGKKYRTVYINEKVWLAENLAETQYRDSSPIAKVTGDVAWAALTTAAYCAYDNNESYAII